MTKPEVSIAAGPDPVDVHVGARVRTLRKRHRMSQKDLAGRLGVSFQQVQKYERAANRISGSCLYKIATLFKLSIAALFDGLPDPMVGGAREHPPEMIAAQLLDELINTSGGRALAEAFMQMHPQIRWRLVDIARTMAQLVPDRPS